MEQEKEPTSNQINYARSLGIYIPFGITFDELSDLISNIENNDKLASDRHKAFADFYGIKYTKNVGKKQLFNQIKYEVFSNNKEEDMASWFIFRVYRSLVLGVENVSITSPNNSKIKEITETLLKDPKFLNSLKRYVNSDLRYFGEFTDSRGITHYGASKNTNSYKLALNELKKYKEIQEDIEKSWNKPISLNNNIKPEQVKNITNVPSEPVTSFFEKIDNKLKKMNEEADQKYKERKAKNINKSIKITYILLILFGFFGIHRFYLGRIKSANTIAIISAISLLVAQPLIIITIIWMIIDLFLIPKMIKNPESEWF